MFSHLFGRLFAGRNGIDMLAKVILLVAAILILVTVFTHNAVVYLFAVAALLYFAFRIMSRNVSKRYVENQTCLRVLDYIRSFFKNAPWRIRAWFTETKRKVRYGSNKRQERKKFRIFVCPSCSQKVRVPRSRGKIEITCPKCAHTFMKRS